MNASEYVCLFLCGFYMDCVSYYKYVTLLMVLVFCLRGTKDYHYQYS